MVVLVEVEVSMVGIEYKGIAGRRRIVKEIIAMPKLAVKPIGHTMKSCEAYGPETDENCPAKRRSEACDHDTDENCPDRKCHEACDSKNDENCSARKGREACDH